MAKTKKRTIIEVIYNCASCIHVIKKEENLYCPTKMKEPGTFDKTSLVVMVKNCPYFRGAK